MASPLQSLLNDGYWSQFKLKRPEMQSAFGFDQDSAFGANMVPRSNKMNPAPLRNAQNAQLGQYAQNPMGAEELTAFNRAPANQFQNLMGATEAVAPNYAQDSVGQPFSGITSESGIFDSLLSDKAKEALTQGAETGLMSMIPSAADVVGQRVTGSRLGGKLASTAATTGLAAAQGFTNPVTDAAALLKALQSLGIF